MQGLPFTRKETDYLRNLVEQEKIRLIEDISSVKARHEFSQSQKDILKAVMGPNYFKTKGAIKRLEEALKLIKGIESILYPGEQKIPIE